MVLKEQDVLSTKQLVEYLGIKESTFKNNKEKYLENLALYYDFEVFQKGRGNFYRILKKKGEYKAPPRKIAKKMIEKNKIYEEEIVEVIKEDPVQTYANVNRELVKKGVVEKLEYEITSSYNNVTKNMKILFGSDKNEGGTRGKIIDKIWCRLDKATNRYVRLNSEEVSDFFTMINEKKVDNRLIEMLDEYINNEITKDKVIDILEKDASVSYKAAREQFKNKYNYYPQKVKVYMLEEQDNKENGIFEWE